MARTSSELRAYAEFLRNRAEEAGSVERKVELQLLAEDFDVRADVREESESVFEATA